MARRLAPDSRIRAVGWGFGSQISSSAKNLLLTLIAARALGPDGLGIVVLGFALYLFAIGLNRALIVEPLIVLSSGVEPSARRSQDHLALTMTLSIGAVLSVILVGVGLLVPGAIAEAMLVFGPWIVPALLSDFWRSVLFRDERGVAGTAIDVAWLAAMALALGAAWPIGTTWAVVAAWGIGALASAITGFFLTELRPGSLRGSALWGGREAWPLGRWLMAEQLVYHVNVQGQTLAIAATLGSAAVGGFGAVLTVYAPLSVLIPAISVSGLPAISRAVRLSITSARDWAIKLSAIGVALTLGYVASMSLLGKGVLSTVFGTEFESYEDLILPVGLQQVLGVATLGAVLLLKGVLAPRLIVLVRAVVMAPAIATTIFVGLYGDLELVAWAVVAWTGVLFVLMALAARSASGRFDASSWY